MNITLTSNAVHVRRHFDSFACVFFLISLSLSHSLRELEVEIAKVFAAAAAAVVVVVGIFACLPCSNIQYKQIMSEAKLDTMKNDFAPSLSLTSFYLRRKNYLLIKKLLLLRFGNL